jgi:hypothetical protein
MDQRELPRAGTNALFLAVYQKPFPVAGRGLQSRLNF